MTNNQQYTYYQQPVMPQPPIPMRQRMANGARRMQNAFPKWLTQYSIVVYILALCVVSLMYSSYTLPWYYILTGVISVLAFFLYGGKVISDNTIDRVRKEKRFERRIFLIAFTVRVLFMLLLFWIFQVNYGDAFGFENADAVYYDEMGQFVSGLIEKGNFHFYDEITKWNGGHGDIADMGYGIYVGLVYWLTGSEGVVTAVGIGAENGSIIVVRLLKCLISSYTVLLMYRLAKRNFNTQTARIAAIFCALWPNFWYYCACHLKETEMVFLCVLFVEQADQMLRSRQFTAWKVIPVLLIAAAILTFRTVLALVVIMALVFTIVMSSTKVVNWGKRVIVGGLAILLVVITMGNQIEEQAYNLFQTVQSGDQHENMEWRGRREHGNSFAKYAGTAVFAPMIFTLPFPTLAQAYEGQDMQMIANGGNFVKNILSCFTIFAMVLLLMSGRWREHLLPLSFMLGYLVVLAFSSFAQSERFHQPAMPFEFMFAAYGLSIAVTNKKYKRWFSYWCALMFIAPIAWNWFKLAGRGLV